MFLILILVQAGSPMLHLDDDSQWVGGQNNFSSKEECFQNTSNCYRCYIRDEEFYQTFQIVIDSIVIFVSSLGLMGNFLSIYILSRKEFTSRFSNLLIMLAYADIRCFFSIHNSIDDLYFNLSAILV